MSFLAKLSDYQALFVCFTLQFLLTKFTLIVIYSIHFILQINLFDYIINFYDHYINIS